MGRSQWHLQRHANGLTLARHWPPRLDVQGATHMSLPTGPICLRHMAHQIRQDVWRMLRRLRGFSPVVILTRAGSQLEIRAGGRAAFPVSHTASGRIAELLSDPHHKERWIRWAKEGKCA